VKKQFQEPWTPHVGVLSVAVTVQCIKKKEKQNKTYTQRRDFLGGPVVKTLCFHCRGRGFHLWLGKIPHAAWHGQKKKERGFPRHLPPTQTPLFTVPVTSHSVHFFPHQMFSSSPYLPHSPFLKTQTKSISSTLDSQWIQSTSSLSTWQVLTFLFPGV